MDNIDVDEHMYDILKDTDKVREIIERDNKDELENIKRHILTYIFENSIDAFDILYENGIIEKDELYDYYYDYNSNKIIYIKTEEKYDCDAIGNNPLYTQIMLKHILKINENINKEYFILLIHNLPINELVKIYKVDIIPSGILKIMYVYYINTINNRNYDEFVILFDILADNFYSLMGNEIIMFSVRVNIENIRKLYEIEEYKYVLRYFEFNGKYLNSFKDGKILENDIIIELNDKSKYTYYYQVICNMFGSINMFSIFLRISDIVLIIYYIGQDLRILKYKTVVRQLIINFSYPNNNILKFLDDNLEKFNPIDYLKEGDLENMNYYQLEAISFYYKS